MSHWFGKFALVLAFVGLALVISVALYPGSQRDLAGTSLMVLGGFLLLAGIATFSFRNSLRGD